MIYIFSDSGRIPMTYNGLTLNSVTDAGQSGKQGIELHAVACSPPADFISEKLQWRRGIHVAGITNSSQVIQVNGVIHGTTMADLADRVESFVHAFDPGWIAFANPTDPFLPFTFSVPTTDTTNFPTGLAASQVFAIPTERPRPVNARASGRSARFRLTLLQPDPTRYLTTASTTTGGAITNIGNTTSWPTVTFTMSGAGHASFTIATSGGTVQGSKSLVLDLSGRSTGQVITVDFDQREIFVNSTRSSGIFKSGDWFEIEPGSQTIAFSNTTNTGTKTLTWYPAYS